MAAREEILSKYGEQAQLRMQRGEVYTPAEFMMRSNPGSNEVYVKRKVYDTDTGEYLGTKTIRYETSYANYKSAARAFNKLERGTISGERLQKRGELYVRRGQKEGPRGRYFELDKPLSGYQTNLWKVLLWVDWDERTDSGAIVHHEAEERSFVVQSRRHGSNYDASYIEAATADVADEFLEQWADDEEGYGQVVGDMVIVDRMAIKISTTSLMGEQIVHIP